MLELFTKEGTWKHQTLGIHGVSPKAENDSLGGPSFRGIAKPQERSWESYGISK